MKTLLLLIFLLFSVVPRASAKLVIAPGVSATAAHMSDEKSSEGKNLLKLDSALGMNLDFEWNFLNDSISVVLGAQWRGGESVTQYSYTNPTNPLDTATVEDLDTNSSQIAAQLGPRFRFVNLKYFKAFAGAGWTPGIMYLTFIESEFKQISGSEVGLKENENQNFQGTYFELGVELYSIHSGAIKLLGRQTSIRSDRFETMGDKHISLSYQQLAVQYMHLF